MSRTVRVVLIVLGAVAALVGVVFAGQGAGLIPGSSMTGDRFWLAVGLILAVAGVAVVIFGARRPKR